MHNKSVLIINRVYPPHHGATGRMAQNLAHFLSENGWTVSVLTTGESSGLVTDNKVSVTKIKAQQSPQSSAGYIFISLRLLMKALRHQKTDIVISMSDPPMGVLIGGLVSRFKKSKHVHWCHDVYPDLLPLFQVKLPKFIQKFLHRLSRRRMNKAALVVTIGRCMSKRLALTGVDQTKIEMIPNWASPDIFSSQDPNMPLLKAKAEMPENMFRDDSPKFRVLYAGNIGKAHEIDVFLKTAQLLQDKKEIEFVFVGTSKAHESLAEERGKLGLDNIKFMPFQPPQSLRAVLESGDLHIVSMKTNMNGLLVPCKFYAALSVGRPTLFLGPTKSEIGKVIAEYKAGKIVETIDPQALSKAILSYRNDGQLWFEAQQGALKAGEQYNPQKSLETWGKSLDHVLELS